LGELYQYNNPNFFKYLLPNGSDERKGIVTLPQINHDLYLVMIREMEDRVFGSDERIGTVILPQLTKYLSRVI
jgi:hypothetical protein